MGIADVLCGGAIPAHGENRRHVSLGSVVMLTDGRTAMSPGLAERAFLLTTTRWSFVAGQIFTAFIVPGDSVAGAVGGYGASCSMFICRWISWPFSHSAQETNSLGPFPRGENDAGAHQNRLNGLRVIDGGCREPDDSWTAPTAFPGRGP